MGDQNSIPKDLRPLNIPRTVGDEPRIPIGRSALEGFCPNSVVDVNSLLLILVPDQYSIQQRYLMLDMAQQV